MVPELRTETSSLIAVERFKSNVYFIFKVMRAVFLKKPRSK